MPQNTLEILRGIPTHDAGTSSGNSYPESTPTSIQLEQTAVENRQQPVSELEEELLRDYGQTEGTRQSQDRKKIEALSPFEMSQYEIPEGFFLVGEYITEGAFHILAAHPGTGKSTLAFHLAKALADGHGEWMGLPIRSQCNVLILQSENSRKRLKDESGIFASDLEYYEGKVWVTPPPEEGLEVANPEFSSEVQNLISKYGIRLLIIDPLTDVDGMGTKDKTDVQRAYSAVRALVPPEDREKVAILALCHLRKPSGIHGAQDQARLGRDLLHDLPGSLYLGAKVRTMFGLMDMKDMHQQEQPENKLLVLCKSNDAPPMQACAFRYRKCMPWEKLGYELVEQWVQSSSRNRRGSTETVSWEAIDKYLEGRSSVCESEIVTFLAKNRNIQLDTAKKHLRNWKKNVTSWVECPEEKGRLIPYSAHAEQTVPPARPRSKRKALHDLLEKMKANGQSLDPTTCLLLAQKLGLRESTAKRYLRDYLTGQESQKEAPTT